MVRRVKAYAVRRDEILDAAQALIYSKGYDQMTVQDILDSVQIAKGTFYHYFDSKQALLEAMIDHLMAQMEKIVAPIINDSSLPALEKLQRFASTLDRWKTAQKTFLLAMLRVWYTDDNALVREKVRLIGTRRFVPLIARIIQQGIEEGSIHTPYPDETAEIFFSMVQALEGSIGLLVISTERDQETLLRAERTAAAFNSALERILGASADSLMIVDPETFRAWFALPATLSK
jgi:AcrR family transcriptional regulator